MKLRRWSILALTSILFACAVPAFAADGDPSRVLRSVSSRGAMLDLKVVDGKGRPMSGVRVTAVASDLSDVQAITGPDGVAHLDGLPNQSTGTVHASKKQNRSVPWNILIESGKDNKCTVQFYTVMEGNALKMKLPTPGRIEHKWEPITYQGPTLPLKSLKVIDNNWQELTFHPTSKGVITLAYTRPWEWSGKPMPITTDWHLAVYTVIKKPKPVETPSAESIPMPAPPAE